MTLGATSWLLDRLIMDNSRPDSQRGDLWHPAIAWFVALVVVALFSGVCGISVLLAAELLEEAVLPPWLFCSTLFIALAAVPWAIYFCLRSVASHHFQFSVRALLVAVGVFALPFGMLHEKSLHAWRNYRLRANDVAWSSPRPGEPRSIVVQTDRGLQLLTTHPEPFGDTTIIVLVGQRITDVSADCAEGMVRLPNLRTAVLKSTAMTGRGLDLFSKCEHLDNLVIRECGRLTDDELQNLKELKRLRQLAVHGGGNLGMPPITDAGLAHVAHILQLESLELTELPITDAGLLQLKDLSNLRRFHLQGTRVTPAGVQKLQEALPNCTIQVEP